ncbi:hypothetical protein BLNAU_23896 [Blattamonas nauphoetae]|uniref:Uncharacterized protein n=1 Tax=Blattamonas nauphoetae TaxID=2049346 RepID=A0ABQ9WNY4_9EUKA|nr:hypothetical protein BLNAU_23896 [Blattamonas nauphoetae]
MDDLRQGCVSLFEQVNTSLDLTPIEVNHASRFLKYTEIHMKQRHPYFNELLVTIFPKTEPPHTKLTSALIKLVCHPSNTLQTVALAFIDIGLRTSSCGYLLAKVAPGFVSQLFNCLRPQEIPLNEYTIDFHRHMTSILDRCFDHSHSDDVCRDLGISQSSPRSKTLTSEIEYPIFQPFDKYLQHLLVPPICPSDYHYGKSLLWKTTFKTFTNELDEGFVKHVWSDWFPGFIDAVAPSKLPFTADFESLHDQLIHMMSSRIYKIRQSADSTKDEHSQRELDELFKSFYIPTRDYIIHLSLNPFALVTLFRNSPILSFLERLFQPDSKHSLDKHFREDAKKVMDASALALSSPPFILTSQLVCRLTDDEIINIVDRIVALLESDSPLDDDTILRIRTVYYNHLSGVYLPDLFRKAGRSTEQYFHTFKCLLSLPINCLNLSPISCLLHRKQKQRQPTFDEWNEVDLEAVSFIIQTIKDLNLSSSNSFLDINSTLFFFVTHIVPQISPCAKRLNQSQLERLIVPSIDILSEYYFHRGSSDYVDKNCQEIVFSEINRLCEQCIITMCLSRIGFFSRLISGLLNDRTSLACESCLDIFIHPTRSSGRERADTKKHRRTVPHFLEEGLQDALEFMFVRKKSEDTLKCPVARVNRMMLSHGSNVGY